MRLVDLFEAAARAEQSCQPYSVVGVIIDQLLTDAQLSLIHI